MLRVVDVLVDEVECVWRRYDSTFALVNRPASARFVRLGDVLVHPDDLADGDRAVFEDVQRVLRRTVQRVGRRVRGGVSRSAARRLGRLRPEQLYAAVVLRDHLPARVLDDESLAVLDVSSEAGADGEFHRYDLDQVRAVRDVLPRLWPALAPQADDGAERSSLAAFKEWFLRTADLVLDLVVVNDSPRTRALTELVVVVEDVWSELRAGPPTAAVEPVARHRFRLDFGLRRNEFRLDPPVPVGHATPARFTVHLAGIVDGCPGNRARIRLELPAGDTILTAGLYELDF